MDASEAPVTAMYHLPTSLCAGIPATSISAQQGQHPRESKSWWAQLDRKREQKEETEEGREDEDICHCWSRREAHFQCSFVIQVESLCCIVTGQGQVRSWQGLRAGGHDHVHKILGGFRKTAVHNNRRTKINTVTHHRTTMVTTRDTGRYPESKVMNTTSNMITRNHPTSQAKQEMQTRKQSPYYLRPLSSTTPNMYNNQLTN
jgi:hypothetical protein